MLRKPIAIALLTLLFIPTVQAQIEGIITNDKGEPLPFASIYLLGTSNGTTSNVEGSYRLEVDSGRHELVVQYIGFEQEKIEIESEGKLQSLNISLKPQNIALKEVVVQANSEDPAYQIIRKAIEKRRYYKEQVDTYTCDVYIKGTMKILNTPAQFLGQEIGTLEGTLDSNRQGIIYLSESKSELYFQAPDQFKETMFFSKVSGDNNGFGFNRAIDLDFNFYNNYKWLGRQLISPIADNALKYYDYQLIGVFYDQEGRLLNKIEVSPKRKEDPVYKGHIYILEDLWNIQSINLQLSAGSTKQPGLDSICIRQVYLPLDTTQVWRVFSQSLQVRAGIFNFKVGGDFSAVYTNYNLNPIFEKHNLKNERFKVKDKANEQDLQFWDSIRPIPLTLEEQLDYEKKDTIQKLRLSPRYLDSMDRLNNRFYLSDLLLGYYGSKSTKQKSFSVSSPIIGTNFNTVQGFNIETLFSYTKHYDKFNTRWLSLDAKVNYGISDQEFRAFLASSFRFNAKNYNQLGLSVGRDAFQFNPENPFSPIYNSFTSLFFRENYMKIYNKFFGQLDFSGELANGIYLVSSLEYSQRSALTNQNDFSFFGNAEINPYTSNNPIDPIAVDPFFESHRAFILKVSLRLRYKQTYFSYPKQKIIQGSNLPDLWIDYERGLPYLNSTVDYHKIAARLHEKYLPFGVLGFTEYRLEAGTFLNKNSIYFIDFKHFDSNLPSLNFTERFSYTFLRLPYYQYSTATPFFQWHFQHHFEGFILDKIPGVRSLGLYMLLGASVLYTEARREYVELSLGLDNIGIGPFRFITVNAVLNKTFDSGWKWGASIGLRLPTQG